MKTLLVCAFLQFSILTCFSQKIIFLENYEAYNQIQRFSMMTKSEKEFGKIMVWCKRG
jgi:hypothetical protein